VLFSRLRLATFFLGVASVWWLGAIGAVFFVAFAVLVVRHARVLDRVTRAETALQLAHEGDRRLARDWNALPEVPPPASLDFDQHPYARDIDLFGHASLTKWLGPAATSDGARRLFEGLLAPAPPADVHERQAAVEELAADREWRESLAIEGRLTQADPASLERFLAWLDTSASAVPSWVAPAVLVLPVSLAVLMILFVTGVTDGAWWLIPLALNVCLSFALVTRVYASFDRATIGERTLQRYAAMFALVCDRGWTAPLLQQIAAKLAVGGSAPRLIRKFAMLAEWSELRTGAALFHFPIQALTLWDFHVLFALERWRRRHGRHVRPWIGALGEFDALSVLAMVRADEPAWTVPSVDEGEQRFDATSLGHPLIPSAKRVANDVSIGPPGTLLLVTGSNMSGKSTLLRAIGLNIVLAQAGAPVCAVSLKMPSLDLHTSIRVQDSLELGLSYFMAALARLKQIVDAARQSSRLAYLLDEVLQGTNSVERAVAVRAVARHLLDAGAIGAMTTHDLALAGEEPLKSAATLVHFTEQVETDGRMTFDYRLRPGIATSTNALRLMQLIGIAPQ
jgi:hypothetical protein